MESGRLKEEIKPIEIASKKGTIVIDRDEHARPETTIEGLAKLRPAFRKDGSVTPGNACGIVDGAAALIVTSMKNAEKQKLKPLARVVSWAVTGVPPEIMGIGPVPAIPMALEKVLINFYPFFLERGLPHLTATIEDVLQSGPPSRFEGPFHALCRYSLIPIMIRRSVVMYYGGQSNLPGLENFWRQAVHPAVIRWHRRNLIPRHGNRSSISFATESEITEATPILLSGNS